MGKNKFLSKPINLLFLSLILIIVLNPFAIVNAGERGILMRFGEVQKDILEEGIHFILPLVNTVQKITVRIQKEEIRTEASTKDLQEVFNEIALNWHLNPHKVNLIFQQIGTENDMIQSIINPAIQEIVKAVLAKYTAEEIILKREELKREIDLLLTRRLNKYFVEVDDISLVHIDFSDHFIEAVEAKQIAEQEAKKAGFKVLKAQKDAEVNISLAKGEAEAHRILQESLTPEILKRQAINQWNGNLPLMMGKDDIKLFNLDLEDWQNLPKKSK
ncbi:membrane protease subunits [Geminocystis sp. NIES-3708]|uniref:prohibitin family protein n=1 Tax=Geminocystis sp. NIES-3708 TaxID=1615909 RepID=UPI0005FCA678|nr:prohibitin family protein [Geminocystis sp. NIES-3708]BAQ61582.1 membrane protease subunits [Geminocystis sp. NIES-3708]